MTCCMYEFAVKPKNTTVIYLFIIVVVVITGTISTCTQANIKDFAL